MLRERIAGILTPAPRSSNARTRRGRILALAMCLVAPFFLLSVSFRAPDKLFGTWLRPDLSVLQRDDLRASHKLEAAYIVDPARSREQYAWNEDGTGSMTLSGLPDVPARRCRFVIEEKWTDRDGYTWYHIQARWSGMPFPLYALIRLHPSGTSYELTDSPLGYPVGFLGTPGDEKHKVFVRL